MRPPRIPIYLSPGALGTPQEEIEFTTKDGVQLRGWWVEAENPKAIAVLSHGYVMNRCELVTTAFFLWRQGISCLIYDLRAHGRSAKTKCTFGYKERLDVLAATETAKKKSPGLPVVLIGSSMGSAASAMALADDPDCADALVLDSSYSKLANGTLGWWRFLGGQVLVFLLAPTALIAIPLAGFNPFKVDIRKALEKAPKTPVLLLHGDQDCLATPAEAKRNAEAHPENTTVVWFENCGHSEGRWIRPEQYNQALIDFLKNINILDSDQPVKTEPQEAKPY